MDDPQPPPDAGAIRAFRARARREPQRPYDDIDASPKALSQSLAGRCEVILRHGWERGGHRIDSIRPPVRWSDARGTLEHSLHAWEPLTYLLAAYDLTREERYLDASLDFAAAWCEHAQSAMLGDDADAAIDALLDGGGGSAWLDMTVGQRVYRLAYLLDVACRDPSRPDDVTALLLRALTFHHALLARDAFFARHSNHGLYQALGQLAAARRFAWHEPHRRFLALASDRVGSLVDAQVFASGVHKEHSPGYHYMVLGSLLGAIASGVVVEPAVVARVRSMEEALSWMLQPDGGLVTFGDTDPRTILISPQAAERFAYEPLRWQFTRGATGRPPPAGVRAYRDAGYAFARLYAPDVPQRPEQASYLAQIAGFHSRVHKHADHFSFVWFDGGREILVDPGRYAYGPRLAAGGALYAQGHWYADPKRVYVESTRAHNALEIDGTSYPRAKVVPFGSGLLSASEQDGLAVTRCHGTHLRRVRHMRVVVMAPGRFLLVLDWLNDRTSEHRYRQWFQFAPAWQVAVDGAQVCASAAASTIRMASLVPESVVAGVTRGQEEPELLGWTSDKANSLVAAAAACVSATAAAGMGRFATLFVLGRRLDVDPSSTFNATMRSGLVRWADDRGAHALAVDASGAAEDVVVTLT